MKKLALIMLLGFSLLKAEVLCTYNTVAWPSSTVSSVRDSVNYQGSTYSGLLAAASTSSSSYYSTLQSLQSIYSSYGIDMDYAIYFASDASGCTHTYDGYSTYTPSSSSAHSETTIHSINKTIIRTRAINSASRLISAKVEETTQEKDDATEEENKEEENVEAERKNFSFSIGAATSMSDGVSLFDSNIIPISFSVGTLMLNYIHTDYSETFGIGKSARTITNTSEWAFNYTTMDYFDNITYYYHAAGYTDDGVVNNFGISSNYNYPNSESNSDFLSLDLDINFVQFNPIMNVIYWHWGLNLYELVTAQDDVSSLTLKYGGLIGLSYFIQNFTLSLDTGQYWGYSKVSTSYSDGDFESLPDEPRVINFTLNYNY